MSHLRAWWVDDSSAYAGVDGEQAIRAAMHDTGYDREDFEDDPTVVDPGIIVVDEDDGEEITVGQILAEMTEPGCVFSTES